MSKSKTSNTMANVHVLLQRGRIVSQFLLWNFEGKIHNFLHSTAENVSTAPHNDDFDIFLRSSAKKWEFLPTKIQCKNWLAILSLCNDMWNLAVVLPVWLWCFISKSDKKGLDSVSGAQTRQLCLFLAVKCNKLEIFTLKVAKQTLTSYPSSL